MPSFNSKSSTSRSHHDDQQLPSIASGLQQGARTLGAVASPNITTGASGTSTSTPAESATNITGSSTTRGRQDSYTFLSQRPEESPRMMADSAQQMSNTINNNQQQYAQSVPHTPTHISQSQTPSSSHGAQPFSPQSHSHFQPNSQSHAAVGIGGGGGSTTGGSRQRDSAAPNIHLHQATPQSSSFASPPLLSSSSMSSPSAGSAANVPSILQPGTASSRSGASSTTYPAPKTIPTMPPINTNQPQYTPSARPSLNPQHSHSRSSPAGLDQKYIPFNATTPTNKPYSPQTPSMAASHSPLGLSDIRPRMAPEFGNETYSTHHIYDHPPLQTKCNYLAPWPTYAYDWCKWPVHNGNSCGKMAVASYLEDPHNFVHLPPPPTLCHLPASVYLTSVPIRFKSSTLTLSPKRSPLPALQPTAWTSSRSPRPLAPTLSLASLGNLRLPQSNPPTSWPPRETISACGHYHSPSSLSSPIPSIAPLRPILAILPPRSCSH